MIIKNLEKSLIRFPHIATIGVTINAGITNLRRGPRISVSDELTRHAKPN